MCVCVCVPLLKVSHHTGTDGWMERDGWMDDRDATDAEDPDRIERRARRWR